jgi:hypothetical protein
LSVISIFYFIFAAVLLLLLAWVLFSPRKLQPDKRDVSALEAPHRSHASYLPQIRRALAPADFAYLHSLGFDNIATRLQKERRQIALDYLPAVKRDFDRMLRMARNIASLSPEVSTVQEWERLRLSFQFSQRYQMIRLGLLCGITPLPQFHSLNQMIGVLATRLEVSLKELGERAAAAGELASAVDGRVNMFQG